MFAFEHIQQICREQRSNLWNWNNFKINNIFWLFLIHSYGDKIHFKHSTTIAINVTNMYVAFILLYCLNQFRMNFQNFIRKSSDV